jgi:hypothetical protein
MTRRPRAGVSPPDDRPEQARYEAIVDTALRLGCDVTRFAQARASKQTPGIPDLYLRHGRARIRLWAEIKTDAGGLSEPQRRWHRTELDAGGDVVTLRTEADLVDALAARGLGVRRTA